MTKKIKPAVEAGTYRIGSRAIPVSPERIAARQKLLETSDELESIAAEIAQEIATRFERFNIAPNVAEITARLCADVRDGLKAQLLQTLVDELTEAHDQLFAEVLQLQDSKAAAARRFKIAYSGTPNFEPGELVELRSAYLAGLQDQREIEDVLRNISNAWRKTHSVPLGDPRELPAATLYQNAARFEPGLA